MRNRDDGMSKLTDAAAVVRILVEYFSAHSPEEGERIIVDVAVTGIDAERELSLIAFKDDLLRQPVVSRMVQRFRQNPFDMENVFDLEDVLKKAVHQHPLFSGVEDAISETEASEDVPDEAEPTPTADLVSRGDNEQQSFVRYMRWAHDVCYAAGADLPIEDLTAPRHIPFDSILSLLNHVYIMQLVWQAHLQGRPHGFTSRRPAEDIGFTELRQKQAELDDWFVTYADELLPEKGGKQVSFEFIGGGAGLMSRSEILQHVVTHATYHRGHICGVFYQLGLESPTTDLPVFLRLCAEQK